MTVDEPAADLGVVAAIASSVRNRVIPATTAMFGEVGLAGEVRGITQAALRVREAAQMGFRRCILPEANMERTVDGDAGDGGGADEAEGESVASPERERSRSAEAPLRASDCELIGVRTIGEALDQMF